jgi:hypothetical protein
MEYDQDDKQATRDVRAGLMVVVCIVVAFMCAGFLKGRN